MKQPSTWRTPGDNPPWIKFSEEVRAARAARLPIVALESTVITHGLPRPVNLELAHDMENVVRAAGAVPATVAVFEGEICVGLEADTLEQLALGDTARKISRRDLAIALAQREMGGTTVAATMFVAHAAGLPLFATGGIGGVHRGGLGDVSADLPELARTPVAVVCSGAKAILDLPRTLEWLETAGVPTIGWDTETFPAFVSPSSGLRVDACVRSAQEAASIIRAHWDLGLGSGILICVPCPSEAALEKGSVDAALEIAEANAVKAGVTGKQLTPYLLEQLSIHTGGATLDANLALLRNNAAVAAAVAHALQETEPST